MIEHITAYLFFQEQVTFWWNDDDNVCFVLDQHA
jgi:hypothetical protein